MKTLLIVEGSNELRDALTSALQTSYKVYSCADCATAWDLLHSLRPDVLIINLVLHGIDGLTFLRNCSHVPAVTIALTYFIDETVLREATTLGIKKVLLLPAKASLVAQHLNDLNA